MKKGNGKGQKDEMSPRKGEFRGFREFRKEDVGHGVQIWPLLE